MPTLLIVLALALSSAPAPPTADVALRLAQRMSAFAAASGRTTLKVEQVKPDEPAVWRVALSWREKGRYRTGLIYVEPVASARQGTVWLATDGPCARLLPGRARRDVCAGRRPRRRGAQGGLPGLVHPDPVSPRARDCPRTS